MCRNQSLEFNHQKAYCVHALDFFVLQILHEPTDFLFFPPSLFILSVKKKGKMKQMCALAKKDVVIIMSWNLWEKVFTRLCVGVSVEDIFVRMSVEEIFVGMSVEELFEEIFVRVSVEEIFVGMSVEEIFVGVSVKELFEEIFVRVSVEEIFVGVSVEEIFEMCKKDLLGILLGMLVGR